MMSEWRIRTYDDGKLGVGGQLQDIQPTLTIGENGGMNPSDPTWRNGENLPIVESTVGKREEMTSVMFSIIMHCFV